MPSARPRAVARIGGNPVHAMLGPAPLACFVGALITDIAYAATADMQWANFSAWLLVVGLIVSVAVVIAGLIDFFGDRRMRRGPHGWAHALEDGLALLVAIVNALVHSRDAWTSVVPLGLILSALTVAILLAANWHGWAMVYPADDKAEDAA